VPDVTFAELTALFGKPIDDPAVVDILAKCRHKRDRADMGRQYVVSKEHGFDLMFAEPDGPRRGGKKVRVLTTLFLHREGNEGHKEFPDPPFGVRFADDRDALVEKLGEAADSSLARGQESLWWELWRVEDLMLHASYDADRRPRMFCVEPA
jgi:hypothetical protein